MKKAFACICFTLSYCLLMLSCTDGSGTNALPLPRELHEAATVSASIPCGTKVSSLEEIDITYSREVVGTDDPAHYLPGGTGATGLSITGVSPVNENTYRLSTNGGITNGPLTITITGVTDENGTAIEGNVLYYICDITNPTATADPQAGSRTEFPDGDRNFLFKTGVERMGANQLLNRGTAVDCGCR